MLYIGLDVHKKYAFATIMNESGEILNQSKIPQEPSTLLKFIKSFAPPVSIALEATSNWAFIYDLIQPHVNEIKLAHPSKTRLIAESKIKTDKIDSTTLAHLLRTDLLPTSYVAPKHIREIRDILRHRTFLVRLRTRIKNRIHSLLFRLGIAHPFSDLFGKRGLSYLKTLELPYPYRQSLDHYLNVLENLNLQIKEVSLEILRISVNSQQATLLTSIPGIGYFSSLLITAEIGDISRFPNPKRLCSWTGLVPTLHSSGQISRTGHITKLGSSWLRWILVEAAQKSARRTPKFKGFFDRISRKKGTKCARVALARKILSTIYYMLKNNRPFVDTKYSAGTSLLDMEPQRVRLW